MFPMQSTLQNLPRRSSPKPFLSGQSGMRFPHHAHSPFSMLRRIRLACSSLSTRTSLKPECSKRETIGNRASRSRSRKRLSADEAGRPGGPHPPEAEVTVRRLGGRNLPTGPKARTSEWLRRQGEYTTVAGRSSTGLGSSRSLSGRRACPRQNQAAPRRTPGTEIVRRVRRAPPGIAARPRAGMKGLAGPMENTGLLVASWHGPGRKNVPAMTGRVRVNLPSLTD